MCQAKMSKQAGGGKTEWVSQGGRTQRNTRLSVVLCCWRCTHKRTHERIPESLERIMCCHESHTHTRQHMGVRSGY